MQRLFFQVKWFVDFNKPIYQNKPHILIYVFVELSCFFFLHHSHTYRNHQHVVYDLLFVLQNWILAFGEGFVWDRFGLESLFYIWALGGLLRNTEIFSPLLNVGDIPSKDSFTVQVAIPDIHHAEYFYRLILTVLYSNFNRLKTFYN